MGSSDNDIKRTILVVDDEPDNILLAKAYFNNDYNILPAYDGEEALEIIKTERPDLILLDLMMPGVSGYTICEELKNNDNTKFIPIIIITALSERDSKLKCIDLGADEYLTKPVDFVELKKKVRALLKSKQFHDDIITEKAESENRLEEYRKEFNLLFDNVSDMVCIHDLKGHFLEMNKAFCENLGYSREELFTLNPLDLEPAINDLTAEDRIEKLMKNEKLVFETPVIRKDGTLIHTEESANIIDYQGQKAIISISRDITLRKRKNRALLEAERELNEKIIHTARALIVVLDKNANVQRINNFACEVTGYTCEQARGMNWIDSFIATDEKEIVCDVFKDVSRGSDMHWGTKNHILCKNKEKKIISWQNSRLLDENGNTTSILSVGIDITEKEKAEQLSRQYMEELKTSNEMQALFIDIMNHDLLNPAGIVKGFSEVLLKKETDQTKLHFLNKINSNIRRLIELIETASEFARLRSTEQLDFSSIDLFAILKNTEKQFQDQARERNISLTIKEMDHPAAARANPIVSEVFLNLISNAIKYSPDNSAINIWIENHDDKWIVSVADQGEGIADEDKELIFDRFKRLKQEKIKGTGLGLAIVKRIMQLHGNDVWVTDNPEGQGSVFRVSLDKY